MYYFVHSASKIAINNSNRNYIEIFSYFYIKNLNDVEVAWTRYRSRFYRWRYLLICRWRISVFYI